MKLEIQKIDAIFAKWDKTLSPGCSLAVMKDGEIIYRRGYGMANLEYGIPNGSSTVFHIASESKQFAAMAIVLLAMEGKLSLEDDIRKYLPGVHDFGTKITIKNLVHHTSGLRDQWSMLEYAGWRDEDLYTDQDVMEILYRQGELNFQPGTDWIYCNTGFTALGAIVKALTGQTLAEFCQERIFKPLGMKNTHFHDDHTRIVNNRAYSYYPKGENGFQNAIMSFGTVGATGLHTTVEDWALWDEEQYQGKVVGKTALQQMHEKAVLNDGTILDYALGLHIGAYRSLNIVEHGGADAGYRSHLLRFPDQHFSVAILCNLNTLAPGMLARRVADVCLEEEFNLAPNGNLVDESPVQLSAQELAAKAGLYYEASSGMTMTLEYNEGHLTALTGPGYPLEAISAERFRVVPMPSMKMDFRTNSQGKQTLIPSPEGTKPRVFEKVEPSSENKKNLTEFSGSYFSPEADNIFKLEVKDNGLFLVRKKFPTVALRSTVTDSFVTQDGWDLQFERDEKGKVSSFRLNTGRVLHLLFNKIG